MINIIPAIDLVDGQCVRLSQGDYGQKTVYATDPLETARRFEQAGIRRLHLVDLDGAQAGHIVNTAVLEKIARGTSLKIDFGGGLRSKADVQQAFDRGAAQVTAGSIALKEPEQVGQWALLYGKENILIGADVRNRKLAVQGWLRQTETELIDFVDSYLQRGFGTVICTDIQRDGMLSGPAVELYRELIEAFPELRLIASGGVGSISDVELLERAGLDGVIIGKALYEEKISLKDLERFLC